MIHLKRNLYVIDVDVVVKILNIMNQHNFLIEVMVFVSIIMMPIKHAQYDFRPDFCRVDKMYKLYKDKMTWDEYVDLNYEACIELRKLEREKTENIGKDVSEVIDEDVSLTKIPKEEVTEYDPLDDDFFYDLDEDFFGDD